MRRLRRAASDEDEALNAASVPGGTASHPVIDSARVDPGALVKSVTAKILDSLEDAKAEDIVSLDLQGKT